MAFTKAQLEALAASILASNQPILATQHRAQVQTLIDEMFDAQSRADLLAGAQATAGAQLDDTILVFRGGEAYRMPSSVLSSTELAGLADVTIVDPQAEDILVYDLVSETWSNVPFAEFVNIDDKVSYNQSDEKSNTEKLQARENIGADREVLNFTESFTLTAEHNKKVLVLQPAFAQITVPTDLPDNFEVDLVTLGGRWRFVEGSGVNILAELGSFTADTGTNQNLSIQRPNSISKLKWIESDSFLLSRSMSSAYYSSQNVISGLAQVISENPNAPIGTIVSTNQSDPNIYIKVGITAPPGNEGWLIIPTSDALNEGFVSYTESQDKSLGERLQARNNIGTTNVDEQVIDTDGNIDNLVITKSNIRFTGANPVLRGIAEGLNWNEVTITYTGAGTLTIVAQNSGSSAGNRFRNGLVMTPNTSIRLKYSNERWNIETVGIADGRYLRKDVADTKAETLTLTAPSGNENLIIRTVDDLNTRIFARFRNGSNQVICEFGTNSVILPRIRSIREITGIGGLWTARSTGTGSNEGIIDFRNGDNVRRFVVRNGLVESEIVIRHPKSGASNESVRRDELPTFYAQTESGTGILNNLAINAGTKNLILTGASELTGLILPVADAILITAQGTNVTIRHESASSDAANRFSLPNGQDMLLNNGDRYLFQKTGSRLYYVGSLKVSIPTGRIPFGNGVNGLNSDAGLTWNNANKTLTAQVFEVPNLLGSAIKIGINGQTTPFTAEDASYIYSGSGSSGLITAGSVNIQSRSNTADRSINFITGVGGIIRWSILGNGRLSPAEDNVHSVGSSAFRASEIFAGNGTINTSDEREKTDIQDISEIEYEVAKELKTKLKKFRWKKSKEEKGDEARWHFGIIAQDVEQVFANHGLNAHEYGMFCRDEWWIKDVEVFDEIPNPDYVEGGEEPKTITSTEPRIQKQIFTEEVEGAEYRYRLGVRMDQVHSFLIITL